MPKYKGRKKLTPQEAKEFLDNTYQMLYTFTEQVQYLKTQPRSKSDILVEALCGQTREEMVRETEGQIEYCLSKIEYGKQFLPNYMPNIG